MAHPFVLGRLVEHDPRSLNYPAPVAGVVSKTWPVYGARLDQGQVGSCTGNAMSDWLNCKPAHHPRTRCLTEVDALRLYTRATQLDEFPGEYPAQDTGSSGLAVAKAALEEHLIGSYSHAFGFDHLLGALMLAPVMVGVNWYEGFFNPDAHGFIDITGAIAGGHEFTVQGVNMHGGYLWAVNSWGTGWALNGRFKIPFAVMQRLLNEQGDVTVPATI